MRAIALMLMSATIAVSVAAQNLSYTRRDIVTQLGSMKVGVGDFNRDARPDLAFISSNGGTSFVSTVLGRGDGTFITPQQNVGTGSQNQVMAVGDVDGDGIADVVTIDVINNRLYVLLGNGDGRFEAPRTIDNVVGNSITIGDFNGDGKADLAILPFGGPVNIYLGNGNGTFAPPILTATGGTGAAVLVAADFNHDGKLDLATIQQITNDYSILMGRGDGSFAPAVTYSLEITSTPAAIAVGDVNNDGILDLVISEPAQRKIAIVFGHGDGTFAPFKSFSIGESALGLAIADVNADGRADIVAAVNGGTADTSYAAILLGNGDGTFGSVRNYLVVVGANTVAVANLDGDGKPDIIISGAGSAITTLLSSSTVPGPPLLLLTKTHPGIFTQGQTGATFTINVSNGGGTTTTGGVSVKDVLPSGLSFTSMSGPGWNCVSLTCSRGDATAPGASYPPITVTAAIANDATSPETNIAAGSGGGSVIVQTSDTFFVNSSACQFAFTPSIVATGNAGIASGTTTVTTTPQCAWIPTSNVLWLHVQDSDPVIGTGAVYYTADPNPGGAPRTGLITAGGATFTVNQSFGASCTYNIGVPSEAFFTSDGGNGRFTMNINDPSCPWRVTAGQPWITIDTPSTGNGSIEVHFTVAANPDSVQRTGLILIGGRQYMVTEYGRTGPPPIRFVPVTPCRIADTRNPAGPYGGPVLAGGSTRTFDVAGSACGIPANVRAYSLNVTVVPLGPLGFLSVWPAGQAQPGVSTLNSSNGQVKANAAIVAAGSLGAINLFASQSTHVILDINGYFMDDPLTQGLAFYPLTPCRIADTRSGTGPFAGPALLPGGARDFPLLSSSCGIPSTAQAYSLNMTAVPSEPLGFLSTWPAGTAQPGVSTLNAPIVTPTANAAIVPAGANGAITVIATNHTDLIIDINGYFAPPQAPGALSFYPVTPCRIVDTRDPNGVLGGPIVAAGETRVVPVPLSACSIPASANAYSLNATVLPPAGLGFLTLWNAGGTQPGVSTLNASDGTVVSNAAIVPAGTSGSINAFASNLTHLILDISGYFAP